MMKGMLRCVLLSLFLLSVSITGLRGQDDPAAETEPPAAPQSNPTADPSTDQAADSAAEQIHEQLRALRDRMFEAYEKRDVDGLLQDVAPKVVVTWQNADRNLNHAEFLEFYDRMVGGEQSVVADISSDFVVDGESILYGDDTAVAYGTCTDHFELSDGTVFDLTSKWTATVVRDEADWKVASFHMSSSIFDNPILSAAKSWLVNVGILCGVVGLIVGYCLAYFIRPKPTAAAA